MLGNALNLRLSRSGIVERYSGQVSANLMLSRFGIAERYSGQLSENEVYTKKCTPEIVHENEILVHPGLPQPGVPQPGVA